MSIILNPRPWIEKAYSEASPTERKRAEFMAEMALENILVNKNNGFYEENKKNLLKVMEDISKEAKEKGLTEEILDDILNSEDE